MGADPAALNVKKFNAALYAAMARRWQCLENIIKAVIWDESEQDQYGKTLLLMLAKEQFDGAFLLLNKNCPINFSGAFTDTRNSILHTACLQGASADLITLLLIKGADLNSQNKEGCTPLHFAVEQERKDLIPLFVCSGADLTLSTKGFTPITYAGFHWKFSCLDLMLDHAPDTDHDRANFGGALSYVISCGQYDLALKLLKIRRFLQLNIVYEGSKNSVLHLAALKGGPIELMELLIKKGANINEINADGDTPLHLVIQEGRVDAAILLVKAGANGVIKNNKRLSAVGAAHKMPNADCFLALLKHLPASKECALAFGFALLDSLSSKQFVIARQILELRKNVEVATVMTTTGRFCLSEAVEQKTPVDIIYLLLQHGADSANEARLTNKLHPNPIERVLANPKSFEIDVKAFKEFFILYEMQHWSISNLPMEIMFQIAHFLGHDEIYTKRVHHLAKVDAQALLVKFDEEAKFSGPNQSRSYYKLINEYGSVPKVVEVALLILDSMSELPLPTLLREFVSSQADRMKFRQEQILKLSRLLIYRKIPSPLAYYFRGIYGKNGQEYLRMAKILDNQNSSQLSPFCNLSAEQRKKSSLR